MYKVLRQVAGVRYNSNPVYEMLFESESKQQFDAWLKTHPNDSRDFNYLITQIIGEIH